MIAVSTFKSSFTCTGSSYRNWKLLQLMMLAKKKPYPKHCLVLFGSKLKWYNDSRETETEFIYLLFHHVHQ